MIEAILLSCGRLLSLSLSVSLSVFLRWLFCNLAAKRKFSLLAEFLALLARLRGALHLGRREYFQASKDFNHVQVS